MSSDPIIEAIRRDYEERYGRARTETVEAGRVRDYLLAMDEPADISAGQPAPALFMLTLGRTRRPQPTRGTAVNAGDDFEFLAPIYVGDAITIERRVIAVDTKEGRVGRMYLTRAEAAYTNQRGALIARARSNILRWGW